MKKTKRALGKRAVGLCLAAAITMTSVCYLTSSSAVVYAEDLQDTIAELQKKKDELDKAIAADQQKIDANQIKIDEEKDKQAALETQILTIEGQCTLYQQKIDVVNAQIEQKEIEISQKEAEIRLGEEKFAERLHAMYISQMSDSTLKTLVSAKSFSELINRVEYLKRISETDQQIIDDLAGQKQEFSEMMAQLEADRVELEATKAELDQKLNSTQSLYNESEAAQSELLAANKKYMENKEKNEKLYAEYEAEIDRLIEELRTKDEIYSDGTFMWPLPGHTTSSEFGWRTLYGKPDYHPALDIPAPRGTDILAAGDGKVLFVKSGPSYGNNIAIDHGIVDGKSIVTLYAHCDSIIAQEGQIVKKGDVIAHVGTTGNSTGYHLHLEFRVDDVKVNPRLYVTPF